jgi:hypothetical protein
MMNSQKPEYAEKTRVSRSRTQSEGHTKKGQRLRLPAFPFSSALSGIFSQRRLRVERQARANLHWNVIAHLPACVTECLSRAPIIISRGPAVAGEKALEAVTSAARIVARKVFFAARFRWIYLVNRLQSALLPGGMF